MAEHASMGEPVRERQGKSGCRNPVHEVMDVVRCLGREWIKCACDDD